jgi:MYND finger
VKTPVQNNTVVNMPGKYSKWDSLTYSLSEDGEEVEDEEVSLGGLCLYCDRCDQRVRHSEMKECSSCKAARYCSEPCLRAHHSEHKPNCKPVDEFAYQALRKADIAVQNLREILLRCADKPLFDFGSLTSFVEKKHAKQGQGILVMSFSSWKELAHLLVGLTGRSQGSDVPPAHLKHELSYELWPLERAGVIEKGSTADLLGEMEVDKFMKQSDVRRKVTFVLAVLVYVEDSCSSRGSSSTNSLVEQNAQMYVAQLPYYPVPLSSKDMELSKSIAPYSVVVQHLQEFLDRLQKDSSYVHCRKWMVKIQNQLPANHGHPGILLLRNIFDPSRAYKQREIDKITPDALARVLQKDWQLGEDIKNGKRKAIDAERERVTIYSRLSASKQPIMFPNLGKRMGDRWSGLVNRCYKDMANPRMLVGLCFIQVNDDSEAVYSCFRVMFQTT